MAEVDLVVAVDVLERLVDDEGVRRRLQRLGDREIDDIVQLHDDIALHPAVADDRHVEFAALARLEGRRLRLLGGLGRLHLHHIGGAVARPRQHRRGPDRDEQRLDHRRFSRQI